MSKIEERINPKTGAKEVFLNGDRLEDAKDDRAALQIEIVKMLENMPSGDDDHQRNIILEMISNHLGDGNNSLQDVKDVLISICDKIGEGGSSEEIERVKEELLLLINLLDQKIEQSKLVAGKGIIIEDNVISTTENSYIDKLIDDYEKLNQQHRQLQIRYKTLESKYSELEVQYRRLEEQKESLEARLREMTNNYNHSLTIISKLEKEIKRLEEIIASGKDYKMYKKYEQMYQEQVKETTKWKKWYEDALSQAKRAERKSVKTIYQDRLVYVCHPCYC